MSDIQNQSIKESVKHLTIGSVLKYVSALIALEVFGILFGFFSYNLVLGQWLVISLGIFALLFRLKSNYIFGIALLMLLAVPALLLFTQESFAENFAVYSFLFLVFGVVSALLELRHNRV